MNKNYKITSLLLSGLLMFTACGTTTKNNQAMDQTFEVEYGNTISVSPADYFKKESKDALKNIKLDSKTKIENEKGKNYPGIGEYTLTFQNTNKNAKQKTMSVKVVVKDSVKPTFKDLQNEYKVKVGDKLKVELFHVDDVSKVTMTLDDSKVDYSKEGNYKATLKAVDESKNETTAEINVVVSAEAKPVEEQIKDSETKAPAPSLSTSTPSKPTKPTSQKPIQMSKPTDDKPQKPQKPSHTHSWVAQTEVIHHEPQYKEEQVWIVDYPSYQLPIYEEVYHVTCYCGEQFNTRQEWKNHSFYFDDLLLSGQISDEECVIHMGYETGYDTEIKGYETIPEEGHYETKKTLIKDGWDETITKGYQCACGATK